MSAPTLPGLGRIPADPARLARTVRLQLTGQLPDHPLAADHLSGVRQWMMGGNTTHGTCGPTYAANSAVLTWHYLLGEDITVTDDQVYDLYRRSGNPNFDPVTGADDKGVDMTVMLAELVRNGMDITHADGSAERVKPLCFAAHDTALEAVHAVTAIFGGDGFGLDLTVAQQAQTDAGLWDYVPRSRPWGGHATLGGAYGGDAQAETNITWQKPVKMTAAFIARQLAEAYVVVWQPLWDHPGFVAGVDRAALAAGYTAVTGRPFPVPVPPPSPAPPPPSDIHIDSADRALADALPPGWTTAMHTGKNRTAAKAVAAWLAAKAAAGGL